MLVFACRDQILFFNSSLQQKGDSNFFPIRFISLEGLSTPFDEYANNED